MSTKKKDEGPIRTSNSEDMHALFAEEIEIFDTKQKQLEADNSRLKRENAHLKGELARLRAPPQVIGTVRDVLEDGQVCIKSSSGPDFVVTISDKLDVKDLSPGDRVALHRQTLSVLNLLPSTKDPLVMGAEIDTKPSENYKDIGGLKEDIVKSIFPVWFWLSLSLSNLFDLFNIVLNIKTHSSLSLIHI